MNNLTYTPSPIVLFTYRRPDHTKICLEKLAANPIADASDLFIFSDGPKNAAAEAGVSEVRAMLKNVKGFKACHVVERESNWGLAKSIISGVSDIVARYGKVIVVEDDLVTSPFFLQYMNEALDFYKDQEKVACIHGYFYPVKGNLPETFFLKGADCWGWATWTRGWKLFDADGQGLLNQLKKRGLTREFDRNGTYPYTKMLTEQIEGKNDSWAIRWHASAFLAGKLTLYPGRSLVQNIGMDSLATHSTETDQFDVLLAQSAIRIDPIGFDEVHEIRKSLEAFFKLLQPRLISRVRMGLKKILATMSKK